MNAKLQMVATAKNVGTKLSNQISKVAIKNSKLRTLLYLRTIASLIKDPNNTLTVFELDDMISDSATPDQKLAYIDYLKTDPAYQAMFEERFVADSYNLATLAHYEAGTLGHAYYRHMTDNGFSPDFFPPVEVTDDTSFIKLRMRQTHDIWHVITGYNPTVTGEIALQAFYHGQGAGLLNSLLIGAGVLHVSLFDMPNIGRLLDAIAEGRQRGLQAKKLAPIKWEAMWRRSLASVRSELNVADGTIAQLDLPTELANSQEKELVAA